MSAPRKKPVLNVVLRGHVRRSLADGCLRGLLSSLDILFDTRIYAHTWSKPQSSMSWRYLEGVDGIVEHHDVFDYLKGLPVRSVAVDDESSVFHSGRKEGYIGHTRCPILAWKNMYWGKVKGVRASMDDGDDGITLQMRFDLMSNQFSPSAVDVIDFAKRDYEILLGGPGDERIRFLRMECFYGVDNVYMARTRDMMRFVSYMYHDMDRIVEVHRGTSVQEHIAFHERFSWWGWRLPDEPVGRPSPKEGS